MRPRSLATAYYKHPISSIIRNQAAHYRNFSTDTPIPGLHIYTNFLPTKQQCAVQEKTIELYKKINFTNTSKTFLSKHHNLKSDEYYRLVEVDHASGKIQGQHFEKYGEENHKLTYFIGNDHLPAFLKNGLLPRVLQIPEVRNLVKNKALSWNFTFNTYAKTKDNPKMAGFNFHKDIKSNGEITLIYSIGAKTEFQIRHPENTKKVYALPLLSNSMLILSKESRWEYEHRVIPVTVNDSPSLIENETESIKRISLVLGLTPSHQSPSLNEEKAIDLIWGDRKYTEFTDEEKETVDRYQEEILKEDWFVLPNTALEQEQIELIQFLKERKS